VLIIPPSVSSFFQSVCVLGYCIFPLNIATLLLLMLKVVVTHVLLRFLIVTIGFVWSTRGADPSGPTVLSWCLTHVHFLPSVGRVHVQDGAAQAESAHSLPRLALLPLYLVDGAHPVNSLSIGILEVHQR
jgi:hypothetical protein